MDPYSAAGLRVAHAGMASRSMAKIVLPSVKMPMVTSDGEQVEHEAGARHVEHLYPVGAEYEGVGRWDGEHEGEGAGQRDGDNMEEGVDLNGDGEGRDDGQEHWVVARYWTSPEEGDGEAEEEDEGDRRKPASRSSVRRPGGEPGG